MLADLAIDGKTAVLTLNRPDARNALSLDLLTDLHRRVDEIAATPAVTVLTVTGAGKVFCSGMDLKAVLDNDELALRLLTSLADLTIKLRALPQITVARVNGAAIGGGCGLACVCDLAVTHADSKMGFPEVDLGVCPAVVAPWLVRKIGPGRARAVLLKGGLMSGADALELGMVDASTPDASGLDDAVASLVSRLASGGPEALRATKRLLNQLDGSADAELEHEAAKLSAAVLSTDEAKSRLRAKLS